LLTQRSIFRLWAPLAASWLLMTVEYPIIQAAIARLPDVETMLAAASLVIGLEITIESPVIMLLATTTALARSPEAYRTLRRFTIHLNVLVTVIAAAVAFIDPLYDALVPGALAIPLPIADAARPAMMVMTLWSAAIGWRRFYQGILIRHGRTRLVGYGTGVRLVFAGGTAILLGVGRLLPGVMVGACAWMAGVVAEAVFISIAVRGTLRRHVLRAGRDGDEPLSYGDVVRYHAPLAATSLLALLAMPVFQAGLSRMPYAVENLAAWPILFAVLLLFRSPGFALPEAVIALLSDRDRLAPLRRFSWILAGATSVGLTLFVVSPLFPVYLDTFLAVPPHLVPYVLPALAAAVVIPALQALQSWYRGVLMTGKSTSDVYWGMGIALVTTSAAVAVAVWLEAPGVVSAAAALAVGMTVESVYLSVRAARVEARL
jgi:progressive ankylosis protein